MTHIKVGNDEHAVEVTLADDIKWKTALAEVVAAYERTRPKPRGHGMGFGSQHLERTHDRPVAGGGEYEAPVRPATA